MKKQLSVLISALLMLSMTACGAERSPSDTSKNEVQTQSSDKKDKNKSEEKEKDDNDKKTSEEKEDKDDKDDNDAEESSKRSEDSACENGLKPFILCTEFLRRFPCSHPFPSVPALRQATPPPAG